MLKVVESKRDMNMVKSCCCLEFTNHSFITVPPHAAHTLEIKNEELPSKVILYSKQWMRKITKQQILSTTIAHIFKIDILLATDIGNDWRGKIPHTQNKNQTKDVDWTHA